MILASDVISGVYALIIQKFLYHESLHLVIHFGSISSWLRHIPNKRKDPREFFKSFISLFSTHICKVMDQIITRGYRTSMEKWFFQDKLNMVISSFYAKSLIHYHIWWLGELGKKWRKILFNNLPKPFLLYNSGAEHLFHSRVYYSQLSLLLIWDKKWTSHPGRGGK